MEAKRYNVEVIPNKIQRELEFLNQVVLIMQLENFKVKSYNRTFDIVVNKEIIFEQSEFIANTYKKLYPQAVFDFKRAEQHGYVFSPYSSYLIYTNTFNQECAFSYYYDNYIFTGGAHGTTARKSKTYNVKTAKQINLLNFFANAQKGQKIIFENILQQAEQNMAQNPSIYFDNYKTLIKKNFSYENFYLSPKGIIIYYNQYEIAPYSSGIVEFLVPFSAVDYPPKC